MKGCQILEGVLQCGGKQQVSIREDLSKSRVAATCGCSCCIQEGRCSMHDWTVGMWLSWLLRNFAQWFSAMPGRLILQNVVGKCWECINFTKTPAKMSLPTCNPGSLMLQTCTAHLGHDVGQMHRRATSRQQRKWSQKHERIRDICLCIGNASSLQGLEV